MNGSSDSGHSIRIYCDFDGTIVEEDVGDHVVGVVGARPQVDVSVGPHEAHRRQVLAARLVRLVRPAEGHIAPDVTINGSGQILVLAPERRKVMVFEAIDKETSLGN